MNKSEITCYGSIALESIITRELVDDYIPEICVWLATVSYYKNRTEDYHNG